MDVLVRKGNLAAPLRKVELECLRRIMRPLTLANANANAHANAHADSLARGGGSSENGSTALAGTVDGNGRMMGTVPVLGLDQELDWDVFNIDAMTGLEPQ
ncbi:hypothetical protein BDV10DRAFT_183132 [Aspergillus recurvatus]